MVLDFNLCLCSHLVQTDKMRMACVVALLNSDTSFTILITSKPKTFVTYGVPLISKLSSMPYVPVNFVTPVYAAYSRLKRSREESCASTGPSSVAPSAFRSFRLRNTQSTVHTTSIRLKLSNGIEITEYIVPSWSDSSDF